MPVLFKIIKDEKESFLFGTLHINDERVCKLSAEAKNAFEQASCVLVESHNQAAELLSHLSVKINEWKNNNPINSEASYADYLTVSQIKKIGELFKLDSFTDLLKQIEIPPMLLCANINEINVQNLGLSHLALDAQLAQQAENLNKPVISLDIPEDLSERMIGFSFDYEAQINYAKDFLSKYLFTIEKFKELVETLKELYLIGNCNGIREYLNSNENKVVNEYWNNLIDERDSLFVEKMQPYLNSGDAFVAMGSTHLPGVLSLLKQRGYVILPIEESEHSYEIQTLKNTNIALLKNNLLLDIEFYFQKTISSFFSDDSQQSGFPLHNNKFLIFLDLLKEGKIKKNWKVQIKIESSYGENDWMNIHSILKESNAPKFVELFWDVDVKEEDILKISELFKSDLKMEELRINCSILSNKSINDLINVLKESDNSVRLSLVMNWDRNSSLHRELWETIKARDAQLSGSLVL